MPSDLWARIKAQAVLRGKTLEQFVIELLRKALQ